MKRILIFTLVLFFTAGYCAEEQLDNNIWDFEKVREGEILKHGFTLKNETGKTLTIKSVSTSCGCTVSQVKKKILKPKETTSIEVSFDPKGYSGPVKQFIYVNTDDIDKPVVRFIIKAEVLK